MEGVPRPYATSGGLLPKGSNRPIPRPILGLDTSRKQEEGASKAPLLFLIISVYHYGALSVGWCGVIKWLQPATSVPSQIS
jgi:hypothetical protein